MANISSWADLPNAKHIDRILADLKKNPDAWIVAGAARCAAWDEVAWDAVMNVCARAAEKEAFLSATHCAAWDTALPTDRSTRNEVGAGVRSAILALIVFDDCAYLLDEKPEDVLMLALLGIHAAVLLYPACVALQKEMT